MSTIRTQDNNDAKEEQERKRNNDISQNKINERTKKKTARRTSGGTTPYAPAPGKKSRVIIQHCQASTKGKGKELNEQTRKRY